MNINLVLSHVKIVVPQATEFDVNVHLEQIKQEINAIGIEDIVSITVDEPSGDEVEGTIQDRASTTPYNYYPTLKGLVLPNSLILAESVYIGTTKQNPCTTEEYMSGYMPTNTYYYANGVLYFSSELSTGDIVKIMGRWGYDSYYLMPDSILPYVTNKVLEGLFTLQYKEANRAEYYMRLSNKYYSKILTNGQVLTKPKPTRLLRKY